MEEFLSFCRSHLDLIASLLTLIVSVILVLIKRRPKTIDDFVFALNEIRTQVSIFCERVEVPGNGIEKKNKVIDLSLAMLSRLIGRELSGKEIDYASKLISSDIENVLNAPTKKEKNNEK